MSAPDQEVKQLPKHRQTYFGLDWSCGLSLSLCLSLYIIKTDFAAVFTAYRAGRRGEGGAGGEGRRQRWRSDLSIKRLTFAQNPQTISMHSIPGPKRWWYLSAEPQSEQSQVQVLLPSWTPSFSLSLSYSVSISNPTQQWAFDHVQSWRRVAWNLEQTISCFKATATAKNIPLPNLAKMEIPHTILYRVL